jgi:hypothetical protein
VEHLYLCELCEENLEGSSFTGNPENDVDSVSVDWHLSPFGPHWGT